MPTNSTKLVKKRIRKLREISGETQQECADSMKMPKGRYIRLETECCEQHITVDDLVAVGDHHSIDISDLLGRSEMMRKEFIKSIEALCTDLRQLTYRTERALSAYDPFRGE